ncbi:MerR family transcriptional regulator [Sulfurirhabdus autotrophica]|uniref:MerR family transcriptional regulator n=2 Tax=Sulfurirhabdus autotrophica TaxID=1706046 RepID=A0A4R3Y6K6_9PROT|nr:MerR family transcriptional regulator [Sulfurirhabdus autotrophica]
MTCNVITIGELAQLSGLTTHTIRFYETVGVIRPSRRAANGHRRYHSNDVLWLEFVLRLKRTGMPLAEIKQYADLRAQGDSTLQPRLTMLKLHRERLVAKMDELSECANVLDHKVLIYQNMIAKTKSPAGETPK